MNRWCGAVPIALVLVLVVAGERAVQARPITAHVFEDLDGDGKAGPAEPGVAGAVVAFPGWRFEPTNERGDVSIEGDAGIAWVRVPSGFRPGPVWAKLDGKDRIELPLRRFELPPGPLTFVATSDSHASYAHPFWDDLAGASTAATQREPLPAFFTILGDITQNTTPVQFELVDKLLANLEVPYVPVPGNHDWYDGGRAWRDHYGPDNYSFDLGSVHVVVWNMALSPEEVASLFERDLARVPAEMTVIAMTHGPPGPDVVGKLSALGVDYVLTGHTHTNRVIDHGGLVELNTEPMLMGGLDFTPAGYRVITVDRGVMTSEHRTTTDRSELELVAPAAAQCLSPTGGTLVVATDLDASESTVNARVDCGTPIALSYAGGWVWRAAAPALTPGPHSATIAATSAGGARVTRAFAFEVCTPPASSLAGIDWPQLGGNPAHTGAIAHELPPPLAIRWTAAAGGHVLHGAPAIAHGLVYLTVTDLDGGGGGGVVALDLESGAVRWRAASELPIRGAATVSGDTIVAVQIDGTVLGFDARTGDARWHYELGLGLPPKAAATYGSAVADGGDVVIGNQRVLATIDAASGRALWLRDPVRGNSEFPSLATAAVGEGVAVGVFDRELGGILAWDRATAELLWQNTTGDALSVNASPVIGNGLVYISNGATEVLAFELGTGERRWRTKLDPNGYDWAIATIGTPALAAGVLVVPTLWGELAGLDASSGRVLWRFGAAGGSELRTTHYRGGNEPGFAASPVITGSIVWTVDTGGHLVALDLNLGNVLWRRDLRVPVLAGIATTGQSLVVASCDGTVRALAPIVEERAPITLAACDAPPPAGCCDTRASGSGSLLLAALVAGHARRRRRTNTRPSASAAPSATPELPALHV